MLFLLTLSPLPPVLFHSTSHSTIGSLMFRIVLLLRLFVAGADLDAAALPDEIKRVFQDDALHLYKYAESPIAPILNLAQTTDYFPILRNLGLPTNLLTFIRIPNTPVMYTMPQNRYLTLWVIREREYRFGNVLLTYDATGPSCLDAAIYYHDGGVDDQVLPVRAGDPGPEAIHMGGGTFSVVFSINGASAEYFGRNVLLYVPFECTLEIRVVSAALSPAETLNAQEFPFQTST